MDENEHSEEYDEHPDVEATAGQIASTISRQIVQLHARLYGRGPTRAKTYVEREYVLSVLEDIFTPAERTLIGAGKGEHVFTTRRAFQEAVRAEFCDLVEVATGRNVRAFMSQVHLETEIAVELFLFEPAGEATPDAPDTDGRPADDG